MGFLLTSQLGNGPLGSYTDLSSLTGLEGHLKMLECHLQAQELQPHAYHLFTLLLVSECNHGQDLSAYDCTSMTRCVPFSLVNEGSESRQLMSVRETQQAGYRDQNKRHLEA